MLSRVQSTSAVLRTLNNLKRPRATLVPKAYAEIAIVIGVLQWHGIVISGFKRGEKAPEMNNRNHEPRGFGSSPPRSSQAQEKWLRQDNGTEMAQSQSQRAEALGAVFTTDIAHDLNELLTIALGSLEQLRRQSLDERGQRQLERAEWSVRQVGWLTKEVLSSGSHAVQDSQIADLNELVSEFQHMAEQAAGAGIAVAIKTTHEPLPARLDGEQLKLALLHLVRNAGQATAGKGWVTIRTAGHVVDGLGGQPTVEVSVSDTGPGTSSETSERTTAGPSTINRSDRGTDLLMVQRFVVAAGGKIETETTAGRGTTVRLVFPRHRIAAEPRG
jgi:signal transduction histidine kinase